MGCIYIHLIISRLPMTNCKENVLVKFKMIIEIIADIREDEIDVTSSMIEDFNV